MMTTAGWYPISLSGGVEPGTSNGTRLFGQEIVVWRDASGAPHVWEDRCPHRGMRLSFGFVRSDRIACLYHGWQYSAAGRCLAIPAHPGLEVPASITVTRHSCREAMGLLWAHFGEARDEPPIPIELSETMIPVRSIYLDCAAEFAAERFTAAALPSFSQALAGASFRTTRHHGQLIVIRSARNDAWETLVGAMQPISPHRSAVHVLLAGSAGDYRGPAQVHLSRALEAWRGAVETERQVHAPAQQSPEGSPR